MGTIIVVADLGHFQAYGISEDPLRLASRKVSLITSSDQISAHMKLSERYSDAAGRFRLNGGKGPSGAGYGEAHNIALEGERKQVRQIVDSIHALVENDECKSWYLAADKGINNMIVKGLRPAARGKLRKNVAANLTKTARPELLSHFD